MFCLDKNAVAARFDGGMNIPMQRDIFKCGVDKEFCMLTSDPLTPSSSVSFLAFFSTISSTGLNDRCLTSGDGGGESDRDRFLILLLSISRSPDLLSRDRSFLGGLSTSMRALESFLLIGEGDLDLGLIILGLGGGSGDPDGDLDSRFTRLLEDDLSGDPDSDLGLRLTLSLGGGSGEDSLLDRAFLGLMGGEASLFTERLELLGGLCSGELLKITVQMVC